MNNKYPLKSTFTFSQPSISSSKNTNKLKEYSLEEIALHNNINDCWIILNNKVYNITNYISIHPGGKYILIKKAGKDATMGFIKANHSEEAKNILKQYEIGIVKNTINTLSPFSNLSFEKSRRRI